jgi:hypothetical protein
VGGGYRYFRFTPFEDDWFHEPHAHAGLILTPRTHTVRMIYEYAHRLLPDLDEGHEGEHAALLSWNVLLGRIVDLGAGLRYARVRGSEAWMRLDELRAEVHVAFRWRMLDGGVAYLPAVLWIEQAGMGVSHRAALWFGVTYPDWLRFGLDYSIERLDELHELRPEVPYERHLFLFSVSVKWGVSTHEPLEDGEPEEPGDPQGIAVTADSVVFTVRAEDASSVSLVGSHDGWQEPGQPFEGPDGDGMWMLETTLPPGTHEVAYVIDGETVTPPSAELTVEDGFGGRNAVVVIDE